MIRIRTDVDPNFRKNFNVDLIEVLKLAATGATELLEAKLDLHSTSGRHWIEFGNPNQSSAAGEYPQLQSGKLRDSVGMLRSDVYEYSVGFMNAPQHAYQIEFADEDEGGRAPLAMHFDSDLGETLDFMKLRVEGSR